LSPVAREWSHDAFCVLHRQTFLEVRREVKQLGGIKPCFLGLTACNHERPRIAFLDNDSLVHVPTRRKSWHVADDVARVILNHVLHVEEELDAQTAGLVDVELGATDRNQMKLSRLSGLQSDQGCVLWDNIGRVIEVAELPVILAAVVHQELLVLERDHNLELLLLLSSYEWFLCLHSSLFFKLVFISFL